MKSYSPRPSAGSLADPLAGNGTVVPKAVGRYAWYALAVLAVVNCLNYTDRWAISVLLQAIKQDLELSDAQLGVLTGFAFSLSYALFALPLARWADRGSRRTVLVVSIAVWSAMTALTGVAQNFWQILLARVGVGMGESGCIPTCQSLISDYFPKPTRAFALSIFTSGAMAGKVLGI
jgi:predicted MFS family arabinose efflux permease